jgi:hypothetical protein
MARLSLIPQKREFFDLYNRAAANTVSIADVLIELLEEFPDRSAERLRDIKELEHEGDRLTHEVVDLLNRTFVTPFDRDDMYRLSTALDDICDHVDDAAEKVGGYGIRDVRPQAIEQARVIHRSATKLSEAIARLEGFKDSRRQLIELRDLEDEGDRIAREAISELFRGGTDAVTLVRWKDIHEQLEEAVDACENAADVLEAILVKNQ